MPKKCERWQNVLHLSAYIAKTIMWISILGLTRDACSCGVRIDAYYMHIIERNAMCNY